MPGPYGSSKQLEKRRLKAWKLLREGLTPVEVAHRLGINRRSVRRWRAMGEHQSAGGPPRFGSTSEVDRGATGQLVGHLLEGPRSCGYGTELWTCPRIAEVFRRRFKMHYHAAHVGRLVSSLGFSPQKPE